MSSDLVAFVRARLDDDELWAKAASADRDGASTVPGGVHWTWGVGGNWDPVDPDPLEPYIGGYDGQWSQAVTLRSVEEFESSAGPLPLHIAESEELRTADGAHIVRHDPARVLLQVTAIEAILAHRQRLVDAGDTDAGGQPLRLDQLRERQAVLRHLDAVLEMLAVFWANHPDYRDEWTP